MFTIRPAESTDVAFVEDMLVEAANWDPARDARSRPELLASNDIGHYVATHYVRAIGTCRIRRCQRVGSDPAKSRT